MNRKLKANELLPDLKIAYYYLSEPKNININRLSDQKIGLNFSLSLFLRKERAVLKLAKIKLQDSELNFNLERLQRRNKIAPNIVERSWFEVQIVTINGLILPYY